MFGDSSAMALGPWLRLNAGKTAGNKFAKRLPKQKMLGPTSSLNEDPKQNAVWEKTNGKGEDPKRRKES